MFVDTATISLSAGKGGDGVVAWRREKYIPKGGPAGGNGGNGGSIILQTDPQVLSLESFRNQRMIRALNGKPGSGSNKNGGNGKNLILKIPCGTLVKNAETKEVLYDLTTAGQEWMICKGGRGGKGNTCFKSPTNQAPNKCTPGLPGESCELELELKLIADVGLVGMPNAGKSTFLSKITHVPVKIAPYPFTTLTPNLSYVQFDDYSRVLVADIPGLIENAHENRGLGISFLRHVERTSVLLFVLDASGFEGRDPLKDFETLRNELKAYDPTLLQKPFLVALNKIDLEDAHTHVAEFRKNYPFDPASLFEISALNSSGLDPLQEAMRALAQKNGKNF
jgi:GTP-binding protein